jgi:FkbM family methyltransferase
MAIRTTGITATGITANPSNSQIQRLSSALLPQHQRFSVINPTALTLKVRKRLIMSFMRPFIRSLMPVCAIESRRAYVRSRQLGFGKKGAVCAALSPALRTAIETSRIAYLPASLRSGLGTVVDVGANAGQWIAALLAATSVKRVEAFEPNPEAAARLREILKSRSDCRVTQAAVGDSQGEMPLNVTANSVFSSLLEPQETLQTDYSSGAIVRRSIMVPVTTLDVALASVDSIDLLKIDVQGFEKQVLDGAGQSMRRTKAVLIETNLVSQYVGDQSLWDLHRRLTEDFRFEVWNLSPISYGARGRAMWCDAVFVNPQFSGDLS